MQFSTRLTALRKERGSTQTEIARAINITRSTYSGYEAEGKEPSYDVLCKLAELFDVTTDYLLGYSNNRDREDAVFVGDSEAFARYYGLVPPEMQEAVCASLNTVYDLLSREMRSNKMEHLDAYAELFAAINKGRAYISMTIDNNRRNGPLFVANVMSAQTDLKSQVSISLDKLLEADFGISTKKDEASGSTAI